MASPSITTCRVCVHPVMPDEPHCEWKIGEGVEGDALDCDCNHAGYLLVNMRATMEQLQTDLGSARETMFIQKKALDKLRAKVERVELEAAEWCERARVAEKRVAELVGSARRAWWVSPRGPLSFAFDPTGVGSDRTAVTVALSVEEYGRLTRELADAKARITELQEAATVRVEEQRTELRKRKAAFYQIAAECGAPWPE